MSDLLRMMPVDAECRASLDCDGKADCMCLRVIARQPTTAAAAPALTAMLERHLLHKGMAVNIPPLNGNNKFQKHNAFMAMILDLII